jgi:calpain
MIGIYLLAKTDHKIGLQDMVREPNFMPVMTISEEYDIKPNKNGFYIMPTTY